MMSVLHNNYHLFIGWLQTHPEWGGIIAFAIAFIESLVIVGLIIPGSVTMTAIGVWMGEGVLPIWSTLLWAIAGAIAGDSLSYAIGYYCKDNLQNIWPFKYFPKLLQNGRTFFSKHGGKSVFIGRFVGVMRPIVPVIAGAFRFPASRFFSADICSAIGWAFVYFLPGFLLGRTAMKLPPHLATQFIIWVLGIILAVWLVSLTVRRVLVNIENYLTSKLQIVWNFCQRHRYLRGVNKLLIYPAHPEYPGQWLLALGCLASGILFLIIFYGVFTHDFVTDWNAAVQYLFRSFRIPVLDHVMVFFTSLGQEKMLEWLIPTMAIFLLLRRYWWAALHWLGLSVLSVGGALAIKHTLYSPRPPGLLNGSTDSSFPSGHTVLSISLYGFLTFLIINATPKAWHKAIYITATLIISLILLSRLYLGAHWFSDIVGSTFWSLAWLIFFIISYRRRITKPVSLWGIILTLVLTITVADGWYLHKHYANMLHDYTPVWQQRTLSGRDWWQQNNQEVPYYRTNRLGKPIQVLNIQWSGDLNTIRDTLLNNGWQNPHDQAIQETLTELAKQQHVHLSVLPNLYDDQRPVLELVKLMGAPPQLIVLSLWPANITLTPSQLPLWVGAIHYQLPRAPLFGGNLLLTPLENPLPILESSLVNNYQWRLLTINRDQLPLKLAIDPDINLQVLLIK